METSKDSPAVAMLCVLAFIGIGFAASDAGWTLVFCPLLAYALCRWGYGASWTHSLIPAAVVAVGCLAVAVF